MRTLSSSAMLRIWEEGHGEPAYQRALLLLAAACPEQSLEELARLSIGCRDAHLLTLREWTFGPRLTCITACPACGERLEFSVTVPEIRTEAPISNGDTLQLTLEDYQVEFRLPCSVDLSEVGAQGDRDRSRAALIRRCFCNVRRRGEEISPDEAPAHLVEAVVASMAEHDPQADTRLALTCPGCDHGWQVPFDIVSFFWSELQTWAMRLLQEVHLLASTYGWREADILAMSPVRRQLYLRMIGP
jgi:hypothetical protein